MTSSKKIFFASDFHLGMPNEETSLKREKSIVDWLLFCAPQAEAIFLVGDIFDFWFEYKKVVPKGYVRFLGTLAKITDDGVPIYIFPGNHDLWMADYLVKECGLILIKEEHQFDSQGKKFFVHHGDGLGPGDRPYKVLKKIFTARFARFLFHWIHPNWGVALAQSLSKKSRLSQNPIEDQYLGNEEEYLAAFVKQHSSTENAADYYIFGHRHLVLDVSINSARYINLGEWLNGSQYAVFDGKSLELLSWPSNKIAPTKHPVQA